MKTIKVGQYVGTSNGVGRVVGVRGNKADVYIHGSTAGCGKPWKGKSTWMIKRYMTWGNNLDMGILLPAKNPRKGK
jgi:hypothetical protein